MFGTAHPAFSGSPFGDKWPFDKKSARLLSTTETLGDVGPIQTAIKTLFPKNKYTQTRGVGKPYDSAGWTKTGWTWDVMSYGQDALAAAGANKDLVVMSEPPPRSLFVESITRLSGSGMFLVECTQLDMAQYLEEMVEGSDGVERDGVLYGVLKLDGRAVGEIRVVRGDVHDNCREHSNGQIAHSAIEALIASWPPEEREARKTGKPLRISGRIYSQWSDLNELEVLPPYHQERWDRGEVRLASEIDPHDRLPWACIWTATFPNNDLIVIGEWPPFDFAACKSSPVTDIEDYRAVLLEAEAQVPPVVMRRMDPLHSGSPGKGSSKTIRSMLAGPCRDCLKRAGAQLGEDERSAAWAKATENCRHRLIYQGWPAYDGSVQAGHILVRAAIGSPSVRPKLMAIKAACPNFCLAMRRYAYKEQSDPLKAISEDPQYVHKHYPDCIRGALLSGVEKWPEEAPRLELGPRLATMHKHIDRNNIPRRPR